MKKREEASSYLYYRSRERRGHRFRGAVFAVLVLILLAVFFPVKLAASCSRHVYVYERIEDLPLTVSLQTLAGIRYPVKEYTQEQGLLTQPVKTTVEWKNRRASFLLQPVQFDHYRMEYAAVHHELQPLNRMALSVSVIFKDGFRKELNPAEYYFSAEEENAAVTLRIDSRYGQGIAGTIESVPFESYRLDGPPVYEGQRMNADGFSAVLLFEDGVQRPADAQITALSDTAGKRARFSIDSVYGTQTKTVETVRISGVQSYDSLSRFSALYEDGTECEIVPQQSDLAVQKPKILSCSVQGEDIRIDIEGDAQNTCIYAVFAGQDLYEGTAKAVCTGRGRLSMSFPYEEQAVRTAYQVVAFGPDYPAQFSAPAYISNPHVLAPRTFAYPVSASKKGLQINPFMLDDVRELDIKHCVINITLESMLGTGIEFEYNGREYQFNASYIQSLDSELEQLGQMGIITTAVLLMRYTQDSVPLIYLSGRAPGYTYYGLNMADYNAREYLAAMFTFLAQRYSDEEHLLLNWILGNEVNDYVSWNFCGYISFEEYIRNYAESFRLLYNCTHSVYAESKCMISLDHCWNYTRSGAYSSRRVLDAFAAEIARTGDVDWEVAFHAYPEPLWNPMFWRTDSRVTDSVNTSAITMKNLNVLTDYLRDTYGENHKVSLSENGFSSGMGETLQSVAIVYAYRIAQANDMVENFILQSHCDAAVEMRKGLYFGLWSNETGAWGGATRKKSSWEVFRTMDSDPGSSDFALDNLGADNWSELIPGAE